MAVATKERTLTMAQAISEAIGQEMDRDERVFVMGEDIGSYGGIFSATGGLLDRFGPERIMDTPISEAGFIGAAIGAAAQGLRPIAELMFVDFFGVCMDQIYNHLAKNTYMSDGNVRLPVVITTAIGGGYNDAAQHSQCLYGTFAHVPGLKVVVPSNAYDAKGLLIQAIRDDDPVIFCEHKLLYGMQGEVPEEIYTIPFGEANVVREGKSVTVVTLGRMVHLALEAATNLAKNNIHCEVIDLRTTSPMDEDTILESVEKTGRLVVVDEANPRCNIATDVSAVVAQKAFGALRAPIEMVTAPHTPVPFSPDLEDLYIPSAAKIEAAVVKAMGYKG